MNKDKMNRIQIYLTIKEHELLRKESEEKGLSMADIIRRIIDSYFEKMTKGLKNDSKSL
jgi:hypothetical protein